MTSLPRLRAAPEDFRVEEVPLYAPCGEGEHTYVWIEKRLRTTEEVARELARAAGVPPRDVGYAGRKDRVAVTRQWMSVRALEPDAARALELRGARVLEAVRHRNKLRTGHLRGNRFDLLVRDVDAEALARAERELERIAREGMSNRFGGQRFGRDGDNAQRALALLRGGAARARGDRREQRFLLSALQSAVFNEFLEERCARGLGPGELERGDVAVLHASGGMFEVEDVERERERAARFEISATGPMFGARMMPAGGEVRARELALLERWGVPPGPGLAPPRGIRLDGTRRALRARVGDASLEPVEPGVARLRASLPPGGYVTVLVEELFGGFCEDRSPAVC